MTKSAKELFVPDQELTRDKHGNPVEMRLQVAVVALLSQMAHADGHLSKEELAEVIRLMVKEFHLMDDQANDLRQIAEFLIRERGEIDSFIEEINTHFTPTQKEHIITLVVKIATVDDDFDQSEKDYAERLRILLQLN